VATSCVAERAIPGGLGIVEAQATLGHAADHPLQIERRLANHLVLIHRYQRGDRHDRDAIPGLEGEQLALLASVLAGEAASDKPGYAMIAHLLTFLLCHTSVSFQWLR